jgi:hypothetical protein
MLLGANAVTCVIACGTSDEPVPLGVMPEGGRDANGGDGGRTDVETVDRSIADDSAGQADGRSSDRVEPVDTGGMSDRATIFDAGEVATACAAFASAKCAHNLACRPGLFRIDYDTLERCERRVAQFCPDELGAAGSTRTPRDLAACARATTAAVCPAGVLKPPAECLSVGSLPAGAACRYDSQCQSAFCNAPDMINCGVCAPKAPQGGSCTMHTACEGELQCSNGTCVVPQPLGGPCARVADCAYGLACGSTAPRVCIERSGVNGPCTTTDDCAEGPDLQCLKDSTSGTCSPRSYAGPGEACDTSIARFCSAQGACVGADAGLASSGTCTRPVADGQPCDLSRGIRCEIPSRCLSGSCTAPVSVQTCR